MSGLAADRPWRARRHALAELLRSAPFAWAYTVTTIGALFGSHLIARVMGDTPYATIIIGLCVIGAAVLVARRDELSPLRFMPLTLMAFLAWLLLAVFWTTNVRLTLVGWATLAAVTFLAIVVTHIRDTLQTVRATGDVLRVFLIGSLAIEVYSGILIDSPIPFLSVAGNLAEGGPIQGLFGTRTRLGLVIVIALITFLVELRTRSVRQGTAVFSVSLGVLLAVFTASPIVLVLAVIAGTATGLLWLVRRAPAQARPALQLGIGTSVVIIAVLVYVFRRPLVYWLNAEPDFLTRSRLWNALLDVSETAPIQGWGWFGTWSPSQLPFFIIDFRVGHPHTSALNAYFDVLLQAGWVGVVLFVVFCGLALARAWVSAAERRSTVYTWPALILITLLANGVVESTILTGFAWFLLVVCAARSSHVGGWRAALERDHPAVAPDLPHQD
ncbi:O-antigen ligase family protein [Microbacterium terricola]|uniref:O-antigen ligase family protein n=1 Tax=Microbacterium terricola TaxID=344163 RepID=A0ABM8DWQ9_9MICO|nr:hypothetical protein [Microbacterium terricola]UYK39229.1 hypothetical protein OAU46_11035 [Microbacterium terricola]BDV30051.1 hypothetical protein Microterr_07110 [Microbacterium terricola]